MLSTGVKSGAANGVYSVPCAKYPRSHLIDTQTQEGTE